MSLYKKKSNSSDVKVGFPFSFDSAILMIYIMLAVYQLVRIASHNQESNLSAVEFSGLAFSVVLMVVAGVAAFRRDLIFVLIGVILSLVLLLMALFGVVVQDDIIVYFKSPIWIDPLFILNFMIGYPDDSVSDVVGALKTSYVLNSLPALVLFSLVFVIRKSKRS